MVGIHQTQILLISLSLDDLSKRRYYSQLSNTIPHLVNDLFSSTETPGGGEYNGS